MCKIIRIHSIKLRLQPFKVSDLERIFRVPRDTLLRCRMNGVSEMTSRFRDAIFSCSIKKEVIKQVITSCSVNDNKKENMRFVLNINLVDWLFYHSKRHSFSSFHIHCFILQELKHSLWTIFVCQLLFPILYYNFSFIIHEV